MVTAIAGAPINSEVVAPDRDLCGIAHGLLAEPESGRETQEAEGEREARENSLSDTFHVSPFCDDLMISCQLGVLALLIRYKRRKKENARPVGSAGIGNRVVAALGHDRARCVLEAVAE
jgi:hypothetical protein